MTVSLKLRTQLVPSSWSQLLAVVIAAFVGWGTWTIVVASKPRYDYGRTGADAGAEWIYVLLIAFAVIGGALVFRCAGAIALALGLPGLVLSPFTTPRGDNDGLWTLVIPAMAFLTFVMVVLALGAAAMRIRLDPHLYGEVAAQWAPDPYGRYQVRYFDGQSWTGHVANDGHPSYDPLPESALSGRKRMAVRRQA